MKAAAKTKKEPDRLVPDTKIFGPGNEVPISAMTIYRWDHNTPPPPSPNWPPPIYIGRLKYRSREKLDSFKADLIEMAIARRGEVSKNKAATR